MLDVKNTQKVMQRNIALIYSFGFVILGISFSLSLYVLFVATGIQSFVEKDLFFQTTILEAPACGVLCFLPAFIASIGCIFFVFAYKYAKTKNILIGAILFTCAFIFYGVYNPFLLLAAILGYIAFYQVNKRTIRDDWLCVHKPIRKNVYAIFAIAFGTLALISMGLLLGVFAYVLSLYGGATISSADDMFFLFTIVCLVYIRVLPVVLSLVFFIVAYENTRFGFFLAGAIILLVLSVRLSLQFILTPDLSWETIFILCSVISALFAFIASARAKKLKA